MAFNTAERIANDSFFNIEANPMVSPGNEQGGSFMGSVNRGVEEVSTRISETQESFFSKIGSFVEAGKEKIEEFSPGAIAQRTKGRVVESASQFIAGNPISELIGNLKATFGGNKFERFHNDLVDVVSQVKLTEAALEGNRTQLEKMSMEGNESARELLKHIDDLERTELYDKILDRQKINSDEAALIIKSLRNVSNNIGGVEKELSIGLPEILNNFQNIVSDQRISEKSRQEMLTEVQNYVRGLDLSGEKVDKFLKVNVENFELNQENLSFVEDVFNEIKDDDIESAKLRFSLDEIANSLDKAVLERDDLEGLLAREEEGETFEQKFLQNASLISAGKQISGGFGSALLGAMGLGALNQFGIGDILGEFVGGKIGGAFTKILPAAKGILGLGGAEGIAGAGLGGTLKAGASALGKIAVPLLIAKGLFDFGKGFLDAAEISGIAEENLTFMNKVQAGVSSVISGLTFGLIESKDVFSGIESIKEGAVQLFDDVIGFFDDMFSPDKGGLRKAVKNIASKVFDWNPIMWILDEGAELLGFEPDVVSKKIKEMASMAFESIISPMEALWEAGKAIFDETDERSFWDKAWDVAKGIFNIHPLSMIFDFATDMLGMDEGAVTDKIKNIAESIFDFDPVGKLLDFGKNILGMDDAEEEIEKEKGAGFFSSVKGAAGKTLDFFFGDEEDGAEKGEIKTAKSLGLDEESVIGYTPAKIETLKEINREKQRELKETRREQIHKEKQSTVIITPSIADKERSVLPARTSVSDMDITMINGFLYR
jgi:hypothetical protein